MELNYNNANFVLSGEVVSNRFTIPRLKKIIYQEDRQCCKFMH
jgi:protein involved in ribonucleotide reduction